MQEYTLNSWEEFTSEVERLYRDHASRFVPGAFISSLLFRGDGNSRWELKTTLERTTPDQFSLVDYYRIIRRIQPELETLVGLKWETPTVSVYDDWSKTLNSVSEFELLAASYMAYLRHHGFPSPLLDWTRSPYVAAFFAFRQPDKCATHVSIFTFLEWADSHKSAITGKPEIRGIGNGLSVHKRHFMQQSEYTICTVDRENKIYYAKHQDIFDRDNHDQDLLRKFNIPISERAKVLTHLKRMNINAFSLFGSNDSLLEDVAITEFIIKQT